MELRFYIDPDTGQPHIYGHGVTEEEVREIFRRPGEDLRGAGTSRMRIGQTLSGRYLQVVFVPCKRPRSVFVITAYELRGKPKMAFPSPTAEKIAMSKRRQKLPPGWDEQRIQDVIAHYENQTEDERLAEIEAAREAQGETLVAVPTELVPEIHALLARHRSARDRARRPIQRSIR
jgi:hypothetical protein